MFKNILKALVIVIISSFFLHCKAAFAKTLNNPIENFSQKMDSTKVNFPVDWVGNYKGELRIYSVDSIAMKLSMELLIQKKTDSTYQWQITYDMKGKKDVRNYELQIVDEKKGYYVVDEKNSIVLDTYRRNNILTSFFIVMNSYIVTTYTYKDDAILFEIISASHKSANTTGNTTHEGNEIPEVTSYLVNGRHRALLKRQMN